MTRPKPIATGVFARFRDLADGALRRHHPTPQSNQAAIEAGVLEMGRHSYSNSDPLVRFFIGDQCRVTVGSFCSISFGVTLIPGGLHHADWATTSPLHLRLDVPTPGIDHPFSKGDISIDHDVWIGHGATILGDVSIGTGAVIGAGSIVTRAVVPYSIVAGNPAREIAHRFEPSQREALLSSRWWDLDDERLRPLVPLLQSDRIDDLIKRLRAVGQLSDDPSAT